MKKVVLFFVLLLLFFNNISYAAPAYGTLMPKKGKVQVGAQTHSVFERKLEGENGEMNSLQHFVLVSYGVKDWFSLDLKGGAGRIKQKSDVGDELVYPSYMAGGYGFRLKFLDKEKVDAVFGFQHISVHPYSIWIGNTKHKAVLDDWQLSTLISYDFGLLVPYAGIKYSRMDYIHWVNDERNLVKSDGTKSVGLVVGFSAPLRDNLELNVEGQFFDVQAVSGNFIFKF